MSVIDLASARLSDICLGTVGVRRHGTWTVYARGGVGHGTTYLEAFADALRKAMNN